MGIKIYIEDIDCKDIYFVLHIPSFKKFYYTLKQKIKLNKTKLKYIHSYMNISLLYTPFNYLTIIEVIASLSENICGRTSVDRK